MSLRLVALFGLLAATPPLHAQQPSPSPTPEEVPTFPAKVEQVTVDVVVTDKKHNPVVGLTVEDFSVEEEGEPQQIVTFEAIELPPEPPDLEPPPLRRVTSNVRPDARVRTERTFIIVFDDLHLTPRNAHRAKTAVAEFLEQGLREGDRVTLMATGGGAWWSTRMPGGREELMELLKRLEGRRFPETALDRISDYEAMRIHLYNDPDIAGRVSRRLQTYGVGDRTGGNQIENAIGVGDPWVRARAAEVYYASATRSRLGLRLMHRMLEALEGAQGRKAMLLVSDGFIFDPSLKEFKAVIEASRRASVALYFLNTRGLEGLPTNYSPSFGAPAASSDVGAHFMGDFDAAGGSEALAHDSGGFVVKNSNDLRKGIMRIASETRVYYLLGYTPANQTRDGRYRKIKVKTTRKGVKLRARKGYFAPLDEAPTPGVEAEVEDVDPDIQRALDSPYELDAIPIRMSTYVFGETLLGKAKVLVAAEVDIRSFDFAEKEGRFHDTLEFLLIVAHRNSGEFYRYDQQVAMKLRPVTREKVSKRWYPIVRDFELVLGDYQAKLVVRDQNNRAIGSLVHEFEVPEPAGLRLSTPILSDSLSPNRPGSDGRPRPEILARRDFESGSMLYCSYDVYGAEVDPTTGMPKVRAGLQIRRVGGGIHTRVAPTEILPTSLGRLSRFVGTELDASPGQYELVLSIEDTLSGRTLKLNEPFTVVERADAG